jgi:selenide,water dikinase
MTFDLLTLVESGGCSTKLSAAQLGEALKGLPRIDHERLLVDIETHDDAGVYQLTDDIALIQTTDFFSPICSDPYEFGQIAAANSLSDVYAMGGEAITALNLVMFPPDLDLEILKKILAGGQAIASEAGCLIVGGHTISDSPPKYGLAVTGTVHPKKIITNSNAKPGEKLVLTKPLGVGVLTAAKKQGNVELRYYQKALENMKLLNKNAARIMQEFGIRAATDITGFGLLGHGLKLAQASKVSLKIKGEQLPRLEKVYELIEAGFENCPIRRNRAFVGENVVMAPGTNPNLIRLAFDAQTSGGLLISVPADKLEQMVDRLKEAGYPQTAEIGEAVPRREKSIYFF